MNRPAAFTVAAAKIAGIVVLSSIFRSHFGSRAFGVEPSEVLHSAPVHASSHCADRRITRLAQALGRHPGPRGSQICNSLLAIWANTTKRHNATTRETEDMVGRLAGRTGKVLGSTPPNKPLDKAAIPRHDQTQVRDTSTTAALPEPKFAIREHGIVCQGDGVPKQRIVASELSSLPDASVFPLCMNSAARGHLPMAWRGTLAVALQKPNKPPRLLTSWRNITLHDAFAKRIGKVVRSASKT